MRDGGDDPVARIVRFLRAIGIAVEAADLAGEDTFLPGVLLRRGTLLVDEARLEYPGDLLHEAGHVAVVPAGVREQLSGAVEVPGLDMATVEMTVVPWSYAAALEIGIDPAIVFHAGGYRGKSEGILTTYGFGVFPGANLLEEAGMTATGERARALGVPPYPHMRRWLR